MSRRAVCVAVRDRFPAPVVHVVWWHHIEQGVDPFPELCGFSLWWELRLQRHLFDCSFQCDSGDARRDVCSPNLADVAPMPSARLLPQQGSCLFFSVRSSKEVFEISGSLLKSCQFFPVLRVSFCCLEHVVAVMCSHPHNVW